MTITKSWDGEKFAYSTDDPDATLMLTGPIFGTVKAADGTQYKVSDDIVEVKTHHIGEVMHAIGVKHETNGAPTSLTPDDDGYDAAHDEFIHICNGNCGSLRRSADEIKQAFADRLNRVGAAEAVGTDSHTTRLAWIDREVAHHEQTEAAQNAVAPAPADPVLPADAPPAPGLLGPVTAQEG